MRRDEIDGMALFNGFKPERYSEVRLTHTRRTEKDEVRLVLYKAKRGEIGDSPLIDRWLESEVELIQRFAKRQMHKTCPRLDESVVLGKEFFGQ